MGGGAGPARGDELSVNHDRVVGEHRRQLRADGIVRRELPAVEQSGFVQHGGCGADGGDPTVGRGLVPETLQHTRIGAESGHAGTTGQKDTVERLLGDAVQGGFGEKLQAVAAGDCEGLVKRGEGDLRAGATEEIDRGHGLDLFETVGKDCQDSAHNEIETVMPLDAPQKLRGKTLVVFGCGYVGAELARQALGAGMRVTALTRSADKAAALRAEGVTVIEGDLAEDRWHARLAGEVELAVNSVSSGGGDAAQRERSYVGGLRSILAWAQGHPVRTLVQLSSISVYPQTGGERVDETAETRGVGERGAVQLAAEALLRDAPPVVRRWFVLRLGGIYGPGRTVLLAKIRAGLPLGGCAEEHLNLIHRDDVCGAIWAAAGAPEEVRNEIFNVTDDGAATRGEIARALAHWSGALAPRFSGEAGTDRIVASDKIKRVLGWQPRFATFREGYANLLSR